MPFPVDKGRKLSVHKTFRRRSGCLLNALCTFTLRTVSTGFTATFLITAEYFSYKISETGKLPGLNIH